MTLNELKKIVDFAVEMGSGDRELCHADSTGRFIPVEKAIIHLQRYCLNNTGRIPQYRDGLALSYMTEGGYAYLLPQMTHGT